MIERKSYWQSLINIALNKYTLNGSALNAFKSIIKFISFMMSIYKNEIIIIFLVPKLKLQAL